jgi:hypothetical protein
MFQSPPDGRFGSETAAQSPVPTRRQGHSRDLQNMDIVAQDDPRTWFSAPKTGLLTGESLGEISD